MNCPNCNDAMSAITLEGLLGPPVTIAVCVPCQAFWFEMFKSLQLAPQSTLQLMKFIGENSGAKKTQIASELWCPQCRSKLLITHDWQRNTKFNYWRCDHEHGRFITFFDFLREKDFIHPLSPRQIADLRQSMAEVNCSNCGAPIDLAKGSACEYCGTPISMLDMKQPERMIAQLKQAASQRVGMTDPNLNLELSKARMDAEYSFVHCHEATEPAWWNDASSSSGSTVGLVQAGLLAVAKWMLKSGI